MKKLALFLITVFVIYSCQNSKISIQEIKKYTIDQFYQNLEVHGGQFSFDESNILVTSNESNIFNVWSIPVDGSEKIQMTNSSEESFIST